MRRVFATLITAATLAGVFLSGQSLAQAPPSYGFGAAQSSCRIHSYAAIRVAPDASVPSVSTRERASALQRSDRGSSGAILSLDAPASRLVPLTN
jgi:hypothetical protein